MNKKRVSTLVVLGLLLLGGDLFSKYWVDHNIISIDQAPPFYPFGGIQVFQNVLGIDFSINKVRNYGGAWSVFSSYPKTLLGVRVVIFFILFFYVAFMNRNRKKDLPFVLVLAGGLGNIFDALMHGSVIDLFHFIIWGYSFPIFNVADVLIFSGSVVLLWQECLKKNGPRKGQIKVPACN